MKTSFIFLIFIPVIVQSQFRQTTWDMDKEGIRSVEISEFLTETDQTLSYSTTVGEWNAVLTYYFDKDTYYKAGYRLQLDIKDKNRYLAEYNKLKDILSEKYGPPLNDNDEIWIDDKHKDNLQMRGFAVSIGHLKLTNTFSGINRNMEIVPLLSGKDFKIELRIQYLNPYYVVKKNNGEF